MQLIVSYAGDVPTLSNIWITDVLFHGYFADDYQVQLVILENMHMISPYNTKNLHAN